MTDQPDLKARLRAVVPYQGKSTIAFLCREAADRITDLEAERDADLLEPWGRETGEPWPGTPPTARRLAECIAELVTTDRMGLEQRVANIIRRDRATVRQRWERQNVRADQAEARAQAAESRLALAEKVVEAGRKILGADREALADHRPKWGIADCLDNAGKPYQSQWFADTLRALSAALTAYAENTSSNDLTTGEDDA